MRLKPLLRYRKWEVDEERRRLGALIEQATEIETTIANTNAERARELGNATGEAALMNMGSYILAVEAKLEELQHALDEKEKAIAKQREKVGDAYKELKTVEIAHERAQERERLAEDAADQSELEEATRRPADVLGAD